MVALNYRPHLPLCLTNVLHAPNIIVKILVFFRKFTINNNDFVEFDPFGFSVKDLQTGVSLMRCESKGDLFPLTTSSPQAKNLFFRCITLVIVA